MHPQEIHTTILMGNFVVFGALTSWSVVLVLYAAERVRGTQVVVHSAVVTPKFHQMTMKSFF